MTVDCVVFGLDETDLKVLLIQRKLTPFQHSWALPGGFVRIDETLDEAARRELEEEAGVRDVYLEQLYTFGDLNRDPRERIVTVAYYALAKLSDHRIRAATDAMGVGWFGLDDLPKLAFDHADIVQRAHERLRGKVRYAPVGFELLPLRFSLTQLQRLYEIILGTGLDKRNFRKKILAMDLLVETDEVEQGVRHRAARLYRFDRRKYDRLTKQGFEFAM
jgi:8-oxo-dGTP diphosphatase